MAAKPLFKNTSSDKMPKTTKTTQASTRKTSQGEPRKQKVVTKVYSDYPLSKKNLVQKTTNVQKRSNTGNKLVEKSKTVTNPKSPDRTVLKSKKVTKDLSVMPYQSGKLTTEKIVSREGRGMFNPLAGSNRSNKSVIKKRYKSE